ncbi:MAG: hypothetical protein KKG99_13495 [Bacteroidetes bacterium]|nr:hypothetical protein [Bacteroidota bacterium]
MKLFFANKKTICLTFGLLIMSGFGVNLYSQKVPIDFNSFHGYTKTQTYLKEVAKKYPNITQLVEIGRSNFDRPISLLIISNQKTGNTIDQFVELRNTRKEGINNVPKMTSDLGKPGFWISGATHGNEYTGTEVSLYIIDKLVSGYGNDENITRLVDEQAFYICPIVNPDGVYNSVEVGIPQRYNSKLKDDDKDGKINEDGPDDLNGDGFYTQFRYKDPKGIYIMDDVDPRLMIQLGKDEKTTKERWSVIREDKDNDNDGKRGEDSEFGIDLNRNFSEKWFKDDGMKGGQGDYPFSEPETRALAEFFTNHTNIFMAQFYHTSGGYTIRPCGTQSPKSMHKNDVAVYDMVMGKKYLELLGEEIPNAYLYPDSIEFYKEELKKTSKNKYAIERGYEFTRGWTTSYNEILDQNIQFGFQSDWAFMQWGVYATTTELWNIRKDIKGIPEFTGDDAYIKTQRAILKYQDEKFGGKLFIPWKKYKHPELGEGEIGGWIPMYGSNNAFPGQPLIDVCETHWQFELFRAQLMPKVVIKEASARVLYSANAAEAEAMMKDNKVNIKKGKSKGNYKIVEVTATIENIGKLATQRANGEQLPLNREDVVWLIGDRDKVTFLQGNAYQKMGVIQGKLKIPGYRPIPPQDNSQQQRFFGMPAPKEPRGETPEKKEMGSTREVKWLIAVEDNSPLQIVVSSQKGGTQVKSLTIK